MISRAVSTNLPTRYGDFKIYGYIDENTKEHHLALVKGPISTNREVLVRVHSECLTGDVFGSEKCDCGDQYDAAMKLISKKDCGILIYLRQEGRGIGLINKLKAYALQAEGMDTVEANLALGFPADARDYRVAADILTDLGVNQVRLLTNNPLKVAGLKQCGISITRRIPLETRHKQYSEHYMQTKKTKMGHVLITY